MGRRTKKRDLSPILSAAERWLRVCLVEDGSILSAEPLWTASVVTQVRAAFVDHPDYGDDDFLTKLKGQMRRASPQAQRLTAEMLWALLLFPSNIKAATKRQQIQEIWALSGERLSDGVQALGDDVLAGIGSGGPGFNNYRPDEMAFLIELVGDLKQRAVFDRLAIFSDYDAFMQWIEAVPRKGKRQFRHMLRFFTFPDRVERMSSNNDRRKVLRAFGVSRNVADWSDRQYDEELLKLRRSFEEASPTEVFDFYEPPLRERWIEGGEVRTVEGPITVVVPTSEDDRADVAEPSTQPEARQSLQVQAKLAEIGAIMGFTVWLPRGDRVRVCDLMAEDKRRALIETLPLNYDTVTLDTIEQIDVLWLSQRAIVRAFEVEHTTAVYSGLLRMADLLALQPNMRIRLHIVAPDERREKVFREMRRPVFSLLQSGPLASTCSFLSYESVDAVRGLQHLVHTKDGVIADYEERADEAE